MQILQYLDWFITGKVHFTFMPTRFLSTILYGEPRMDKHVQFWNYFATVYTAQALDCYGRFQSNLAKIFSQISK